MNLIPMFKKMSWTSVVILLLVMISGCCCTKRAIEKPGAVELILLDAEHTDGWEQLGEGGFTIEDGVATSYGDRGLWVYARRPFCDFTLRMEFKQNTQEADSGVFVRFPDPKGDLSAPAEEGYQIEIGPVMNGTSEGMAAIDQIAAPIDDVPLKPAGQWNDLEITCVGQQYTVWLNGTRTTSFTGDRALCGFIGLQNHDPTSVVQFREIRVTEH